MPEPTIILVPGAFFSPEHFKPLAMNLTDHGYNCIPIALPSNQSTDLPPATLSDDTRAVRRSVETQLDSGNNVVLVAHSYGAVPTNNALHGLDKQNRGQQTAILAIIFIAAALVPPGNTFLDEFGGEPTPLCNVHYPFVDVNEPGPAHWFFHDLPIDEAELWSSKIMTASWKAYEEPAKYVAVNRIPCWYLLTSNDVALPIGVQQFFVQRAIENGAQLNSSTIQEMASGHAPFLAQLEETSAFIRNAARDAAAEVEQGTNNTTLIMSHGIEVVRP